MPAPTAYECKTDLYFDRFYLIMVYKVYIYKCYTELYFVRLLVCLTQMSIVDALVLDLIHNLFWVSLGVSLWQ